MRYLTLITNQAADDQGNGNINHLYADMMHLQAYMVFADQNLVEIVVNGLQLFCAAVWHLLMTYELRNR